MASLKDRWVEKNTMVCVGLDSDINRIPPHLKNLDNPLFEFNRAIVDATHDLVCAYKPQIAFYAASGSEAQLEMSIRYIHDRYPGIPVILDAKRGDIGNTARLYADEAFERYGADGVTVNPYMGGDTLAPFLERADRGVVVLCKTSNPGSAELQDLAVEGEEIYKVIARLAASKWNSNKNILLVVGATYPKQLGEIRRIAGDIPFLVPGIGAQGGDVAQVIKNGLSSDGNGLIINSSRGIIYADSSEKFAGAARQETLKLRDTINQYIP